VCEFIANIDISGNIGDIHQISWTVLVEDKWAYVGVHVNW